MMKTTKMMTMWKKFLLLGCFFGISVNGLWGIEADDDSEEDDPEPTFDVSEIMLKSPSASDTVLASVVYGVLKIMEASDPDFIVNLKGRAKNVSYRGKAGDNVRKLLESNTGVKDDDDLKFALGLAALFAALDAETLIDPDKTDSPKVLDGFATNIQAALRHAFDIKNALKN